MIRSIRIVLGVVLLTLGGGITAYAMVRADVLARAGFGNKLLILGGVCAVLGAGVTATTLARKGEAG